MAALNRPGWLHRVISGKDQRPSRFHDESGQLVGLAALANLPRALASTLLLRLLGRRPERPWISYRAAARLEELMDRDWQVLEFGSGMSTLWLARRCAGVTSIESDPAWYQRTAALLARRQADNVQLRLRQGSAYEDLSDLPDGAFDLALVDGIRRAECCAALLPKLKRGGWVYLDNADRAGAQPPSPDLAEAKALLTRAAAERGGVVESYVDFVPTSLVVSEGLLVRL